MLLNSFTTQLQNDLPNQSHFLIGFSGGLDSTALLLLFSKLRKTQPQLHLRAIHIHHGLSSHADDWVAHCQALCDRLAIPLIIEKVKVDKSKGIEAGAREARYLAIQQHILANEMLVTAHHQQDQTETFFLALKRGSGLQGLGAMPVVTNLFKLPIYRPLLKFSRNQLLQYVQQQDIDWIEDESNQDNHYERNFLRNQILPTLRQRWAHFDHSVQRSAQHCAEQQQLIHELLAPLFQQHLDSKTGNFHLQDFQQHSFLKQKALLRLWFNFHQLEMPSTTQLTQLIQDVIFAKPDSQPQFQLSEKVLRRYQKQLYLTPHFADLKELKINLSIGETIQLPDNLGKLSLQAHSQHLQVVWYQEQEIKQTNIPLNPSENQPIQLRFAYSGKVRLVGKSNREEIKKIWQQLNVPPWQRQRIPLIFYGEQLQSAVGYFNTIA